MARPKGSKNRNFPNVTLRETLKLPRAIQDGASGMPVSRLTLAELVNLSPNSSTFRELLLSSRAYGLTEGGVNADRFELTAVGDQITGGDEIRVQEAVRKAVMNIEPYRAFLTAYDGKKIPATNAFKDFLIQQASVPSDRVDECSEHLLDDARAAGFIRTLKGSEYIELRENGYTRDNGDNSDNGHDDIDDWEGEVIVATRGSDPMLAVHQIDPPVLTSPTDLITKPMTLSSNPKKVFIAHGKNRGPLEEIKKILSQFRVPIAVAVDEPHAGRPISTKVAQLMRDECSSAIFIFTADERFIREGSDGETVEVWRPSENVVYELGAASVLYDRRIVILKEKRVSFPSDFSDLGYLEFEADQIQAQTANLFSELVTLDIIEVRAKG